MVTGAKEVFAMSGQKLPVLELITTPMGFDGQTLFPLRITAPMNCVRADFLTYASCDDRIRAQVEAAGGQVFVAPSRLRHPIRYIRYVSGVIRQNGYRVVHAHGSSCTLAIDLLAAKLGGAPVRIAHSHNSQCRFTLLHRLLRPLFLMLYTRALACGDEAGRWLYGKRPFDVVRNAIDTRAYAFAPAARESARAELNLGDSLTLGCVAGFTAIKNHAFLLDVFARLLKRRPDCTLVLVGDGELRGELTQRAQALGIAGRVRFTGVRTDVPRLLQAMDAMLLPSLFEGFPTVALEWQSAGLPVLMSDSVTRGCALTSRVQFLPLEPERWVQAVLDLPTVDRAKSSREGADALTHAGYDLQTASKWLETEYLRLAENTK